MGYFNQKTLIMKTDRWNIMQARQLSWRHIYVIYIWNKTHTPSLSQTTRAACQQFTSDRNLHSILRST